ncbi:MAG: hypothetical protein JXA97_00210 [Anaerolineales bacterium]|nr:hypothetical protein [Anaerolineales bacterium]
MINKYFLAAFAIAAVVCLVSCDPEPPPACTPADLIPPVITAPGSYSNVGTAPTIGSIPFDLLQWDFSPDCVPDHFKILFSPDRTFGMARSGMTDGETAWPMSTAPLQAPMEPATEYFWRVRAWTDGVNGPDSGIGVFFTGPMCSSAAEMGAPELIFPENGEVIEELYAELHYEPGGAPCVPEGYFIDLQTDAAFGGTNLLGEFGIPGTYVITDELADCTTYHWRVAPIFGGVQGPFSETRSFRISISPTCMTVRAPEVMINPGLLELCTPADLEPPELLWPPHNSILWGPDLETFLTPEFFQWLPVGCAPEKYKLLFSWEPDFGIARQGLTDGETVWPDPDAEWPQMGIEPATQYFWHVRGWSSGVNGPDSETWVFFTGPQCGEPGELVAPELVEPLDGAEIPALSVELNFHPGEPGCIPDGYYIDLQTAADFSGESMFADDWASHYTFFDVNDLEDCTTYYWRIAAIEDGVIGPFSAGRSFFTNESGLCMQSLIPEIRALRDLACYEGPGFDYPILGYILEGETAPVFAQSLNRAWWYIQNPDGQNVCAVPQVDTEEIGEMSGVPLWNDPEPPIVCSSFNTSSACSSAGCRWVQLATTPGGYCTDP